MMASDDILDDLLAEAATRTPEAPSSALVSRILADADAAQPQPAPLAPPRAGRSGGGWLAALSDWFGGGIPLAGMTAAAAAGLYLGVAQPASVLALAETVTGSAAIDRIELLPGTGTFWATE